MTDNQYFHERELVKAEYCRNQHFRTPLWQVVRELEDKLKHAEASGWSELEVSLVDTDDNICLIIYGKRMETFDECAYRVGWGKN